MMLEKAPIYVSDSDILHKAKISGSELVPHERTEVPAELDRDLDIIDSVTEGSKNKLAALDRVSFNFLEYSNSPELSTEVIIPRLAYTVSNYEETAPDVRLKAGRLLFAFLSKYPGENKDFIDVYSNAVLELTQIQFGSEELRQSFGQFVSEYINIVTNAEADPEGLKRAIDHCDIDAEKAQQILSEDHPAIDRLAKQFGLAEAFTKIMIGLYQNPTHSKDARTLLVSKMCHLFSTISDNFYTEAAAYTRNLLNVFFSEAYPLQGEQAASPAEHQVIFQLASSLERHDSDSALLAA